MQARRQDITAGGAKKQKEGPKNRRRGQKPERGATF